MISGIPSPTGSLVSRTILYASNNFQKYDIPRNCSFLYIFLVGAGGSGGNGAVGAAGSAAGGGGGGGASQTVVICPATFLPSTIFCSIPYATVGTAAGARITVYPDTTGFTRYVTQANGGSPATNAVGATPGAGGAAQAVSGTNGMAFGLAGMVTQIAGQAGQTGGTTGAPATPLSLPTTGVVVTGGAGGAGLPATGGGSANGGSLIVPSSGAFFPTQLGGQGAVDAITPPTNGLDGINFPNDLLYFYGGSGGGSTWADALTTGLVGALGGRGGYGAGGGGGGGALTGSTAGAGGLGGDGLAVIYAW